MSSPASQIMCRMTWSSSPKLVVNAIGPSTSRRKPDRRPAASRPASAPLNTSAPLGGADLQGDDGAGRGRVVMEPEDARLDALRRRRAGGGQGDKIAARDEQFAVQGDADRAAGACRCDNAAGVRGRQGFGPG